MRASRVVAISAVLFLLFDSTVLGLSYWIANAVESDAMAINIAGRQRMLSQRMTKTLLQLDLPQGDREQGLALAELKLSSQLFDTTLNAFAQGGVVDAADGRPIYQAAIDDIEGKRLVTHTLAVWRPFFREILTLVNTDGQIKADSGHLARTVSMANRLNLALLDYSNRITNHIEYLSRRKTERLRLLQLVAFLLALFNFSVLVYSLWRRMHSMQSRQEQLREHAQKDLLTGLPNRKSLMDRLGAVIARQQTTEEMLIVAFLDLNRFKPVNDRFGHLAGDEVLRQTASRLQKKLRYTDFISRLDGDEFVVMLESVRQIEQVGQLLDGLVGSLVKPIEVASDVRVEVGVSIGAVLVDQGPLAVSALLHAADQLMYEVKRDPTRSWLLARYDPFSGNTRSLA